MVRAAYQQPDIYETTLRYTHVGGEWNEDKNKGSADYIGTKW